VFRDIIACLIERQGTRSRNLLETVPGSHRENAIIRSFDSRMESCYDYYRTGGRALMFHFNLLRGGIAEYFYRREFPGGLTPASGIDEEALTAWARPRPVDTSNRNGEMIHAMARCVTVRQPGKVAALVATTPFSAEEMTAMLALQTDLAACLDTTVTFEASRQSLRGLLAEAALHYAEAHGNGFAHVGSNNPDLD
jgi:hypothetical protein